MDRSSLRRGYPETISTEQLCRIGRISKRNARRLLEHGVIPCQDSGKQTRRFSIRSEDVICFPEQRDAGLPGDVIPQGIFSNSSPRPVRPTGQAPELCGYSVNTLNRRRNPGKAIAAPSQQHGEWMKAFQAEVKTAAKERRGVFRAHPGRSHCPGIQRRAAAGAVQGSAEKSAPRCGAHDRGGGYPGSLRSERPISG